MSAYVKLDKMKSQNPGRVNHSVNTKPTVRVKYGGLFTFNHAAVVHLGLCTGVSFCADSSSRNCFAVMSDYAGYLLRRTEVGQMLFNNSALAKHIIDLTLERSPLPAGVEKPKSMVFVIASKPVDDGENSGVFALIRKK